MIRCTWQDPPDKDCTAEAMHPQVAKDGEVWANLCDAHDKELNDVITTEPFSAKRMLRNWVRAAGGSMRMTKRMMRG